MEKITLYLDQGDQKEQARRYRQNNPQAALRGLLAAYPARAREPLPESYLDLPLSRFQFQPVTLGQGEGVMVGDQPVPNEGQRLRAELDAEWAQWQVAQPACPPPEGDETRPVEPAAEPARFPDTLTDDEAVRIAYHLELGAVADYLRNGLSVLVVCDKVLTEFIYELVCTQAGKTAVLDTAPPPGQRQGAGTQLAQAIEGGPANPLANLPALVRSLRPDQVLVLRSLDMLDNPALIEVLYQRTSRGAKPQMLAFLDPSLEVKKVLTDRFAVHVALMGLPRHVCLDGARVEHTVTRLLTRHERACFAEYDPEGLYKNVAGLNAIQFRSAMQYVGATVAAGCEARNIYARIRQFKRSSSDEIEIPDTRFEDIGGYEHVKQDLLRIIALIAGPIAGISERQRGQLIPRGFIFHGPPGTGKTLFAKAIANEMNATIQMVSGPEIMDKYVGQSESNLRRIFATARRNAPSVVFFDEFDSIASQRSTYSDGGARANNAVVAQFLTELDGFRQDQAVLVIGTTNRIDIIDEALLRPSRLRPIEIGLPDYTARQRVAEIHARNFGVDRLVQDLCDLAAQHLAGWDGGEVPPAFLEALFQAHPPYRTRCQAEDQRAGFGHGLQEVFRLVAEAQQQAGPASQPAAWIDPIRARLIEVGSRYGLRLDQQAPPDQGAPSAGQSEEQEAMLRPMQADLRDLFALLQAQRRRLAPADLWAAVIDLVAEYTVDFNNDEIRAIFQEASLEHHMEGQLITPRYLGQKIGLIRNRRDEREAVHLSAQRGRR